MYTAFSRDLVAFKPGNDASEVIIDSVHFNLTTLNHWGYVLYSNSTLSNASCCYLAFRPYTPVHLFPNGSFVNATSCFAPVDHIGIRGVTSLLFAALFGATIIFTLVNLRKHGASHLPVEKRWSPIGRRAQWTWMLFVAACGLISNLIAVDVDRNYLQGTALILQSFFYTLMTPGLLAVVWEAVRHWGSWQERRTFDEDVFALKPNSLRARTEVYIPLVFYTIDLAAFFALIVRPWTPFQMQRSPAQAAAIAEPAAMDTRMKAGVVIASTALFVMRASLTHSLYHYQAVKAATLMQSIIASVKKTPLKLAITTYLLGLWLTYTDFSTWLWSISPYNIAAPMKWLYGCGYFPVVVILTILNVYGYIEENEDIMLIEQRKQREVGAGTELGALRRPLVRRLPDDTESHPEAMGEFAVDDEAHEDEESSEDETHDSQWWHRRKDEDAESQRNAATDSSTRSSSPPIQGNSNPARDDPGKSNGSSSLRRTSSGQKQKPARISFDV